MSCTFSSHAPQGFFYFIYFVCSMQQKEKKKQDIVRNWKLYNNYNRNWSLLETSCIHQFCPYFTEAIWIIPLRFPSKASQQWLSRAVCLENLNMTKKMSSNPGLTCAVAWKSCSDCKAAWVSVRLLRCLSEAWDKLPNTVRAPVYQVHYKDTVDSDYRWQLGTGKHVLCSTAVALNPVLHFFFLSWFFSSPGYLKFKQLHLAGWLLKLLIFSKKRGRRSDS